MTALRADLCPIPVGWTVHVHRTEKKEGLAIRASDDHGHGFTLEVHAEPPSDDAAVEVTLPSGERRSVTAVQPIHLDDDAKLAFLWARAVTKMREWTPQ